MEERRKKNILQLQVNVSSQIIFFLPPPFFSFPSHFLSSLFLSPSLVSFLVSFPLSFYYFRSIFVDGLIIILFKNL